MKLITISPLSSIRVAHEEVGDSILEVLSLGQFSTLSPGILEQLEKAADCLEKANEALQGARTLLTGPIPAGARRRRKETVARPAA